jgi:fusion and transport protein UGO1
MAHNREGVNPLRPYYIPPTIGDEPLPSSAGPHAFAHNGTAGTGHYASKTRDMFSDIDYRDYISDPSSSAVQTVKDLLDGLLWKYTSALMAQPFDVAKTILQVRSQEDPAVLLSPATPAQDPRRRTSIYDDVCSQWPLPCLSKFR